MPTWCMMSRQYPGRPQEKKVSGELFSLTYGAMVAQLVRDYEGDEEINKQLDKMGYNIGVRLIEDFLARTQQGRCYDLKETADVLAKIAFGKRVIPVSSDCGLGVTPEFEKREREAEKRERREGSGYGCEKVVDVGFKTFLGVVPTVANWNQTNDEFSLILDQNPLTDFVELPEDHPNLLFSNILCGVIRGALEMVQLEVDVKFIQDQLKGDDTTEIRVKFVKKLEDAVPAGDD